MAGIFLHRAFACFCVIVDGPQKAAVCLYNASYSRLLINSPSKQGEKTVQTNAIS
jgi:hypothetical protein